LQSATKPIVFYNSTWINPDTVFEKEKAQDGGILGLLGGYSKSGL
jgi:hypothetical protein